MSYQPSDIADSTLVTCFTELVWLRHDHDRFTRACWNWQSYSLPDDVLSSVRFELTLHVDGRGVWSDVWLPASGLFSYVDSRDLVGTIDRTAFEGVLTIRVMAPKEIWKKTLSTLMARLYTLVDWVGGDTGIQSLHSDQVTDLSSSASDLTEVVILETDETTHELVYLTGDQPIPENSLALTLWNERDESREFLVDVPLPERSVSSVRFSDHVQDLAAFAGGGALAVEGKHRLPGRFIRPYVHGVGTRPTLYHGGNLYSWKPQRAVMYKFLGQGKGNPAFVWQSSEIQTVVNLLNSHGDLESDFWVDAWLYNEAGVLICHRERWLLARRRQVSRGVIADLLPAAMQADFRGHIRLHFSRDAAADAYPGVLQALMEYGMANSVSRVMLWSDDWNTEASHSSREHTVFGSWYRLWANEWLMTSFAATHCSTWRDYSDSTELCLRVHAVSGDVREMSWTLEPHATIVITPGEIWPDLAEFLGHGGYGWAELVANRDLAKMQFTCYQPTTHIAFEHCMPMYFTHRGKPALPPGS